MAEHGSGMYSNTMAVCLAPMCCIYRTLSVTRPYRHALHVLQASSNV